MGLCERRQTMPRKSPEEQVATLKQKLAVDKARLKEAEARKRKADKEKARKSFNQAYNSSDDRRARAHRLIQIGAICEEVYGDQITEGSMQDALRDFLRGQENRGGFFSKALNEAKAASGAPEADDAAENNQ